MRTKKTELDVDFIGGQNALTATEEKAISKFLKQRKISAATNKIKQKTSSSKPEKVLA